MSNKLEPQITELTLADLWDVYQAAREPNWDGYDALPIHHAAYEKATRFLELCLCKFLPPQCGASPSGSLVFM